RVRVGAGRRVRHAFGAGRVEVRRRSSVSVSHVRIDNRLVHGQVVVTWLQAELADTIMVANDGIAADDFQKSMFLAVKPPSVNEVILSVEGALAYVTETTHDNE